LFYVFNQNGINTTHLNVSLLRMSNFLGNDSEPSPDGIVWLHFKQGDQRAFKVLYQRYFKILCSYGCRLTSDRQLLEDAVHDIFIDLWRRREHLAEVENIKFYMFRALRNRVVRNGRNNIFENSEDIDGFLDYLVSLSSEQQSIDSESLQARVKRVQNAVENLSDRQKEVINLRFYHGMSLDDISQLMDLPKQSVSNLLFKSYAVLRLRLKELSFLTMLLSMA
jgi:RNA polymerase sigma factor (sigma-70 family)